MTDDWQQLNAEANAWMQQGIRLLGEGTKGNITEALGLFERALARRLELPFTNNPELTFDLAASWLNRGEALLHLGGAGNVSAAIASFDRAIALLPSCEAHPLFRRRLAIAWHNRGLALQQSGSGIHRGEAPASFERSIAILAQANSPQLEDCRIAGCAWMNRANVLLRRESLSDFEAARAAALEALHLLRPLEVSDPVSAEAGFKARHILCQAIAHILETPALDPSLKTARIGEVTDAIDEALRCGRHWELNGNDRFRPLLTELFRFGARVYQTYQPHFLVEFLLESLDSEQSPGALPIRHREHAAALEALWRGLRDVAGEGLKPLSSAAREKLLATLGEFQEAEQRLHALRQQQMQRLAS